MNDEFDVTFGDADPVTLKLPASINPDVAMKLFSTTEKENK